MVEKLHTAFVDFRGTLDIEIEIYVAVIEVEDGVLHLTAHCDLLWRGFDGLI